MKCSMKKPQHSYEFKYGTNLMAKEHKSQCPQAKNRTLNKIVFKIIFCSKNTSIKPKWTQCRGEWIHKEIKNEFYASVEFQFVWKKMFRIQLSYKRQEKLIFEGLISPTPQSIK